MRRILISFVLLSLFLAACTAAPTAVTTPEPAVGSPTQESATPVPTSEPAAPAVTAEAGEPPATTEPVQIDLVAEPGELTVDVRGSLGPISPLIYGTNYGPWVALPPSMIPDAERLGITVIRWPGGAWGDNNDVKPYQIDQLIAFSNLMGAEASISARLKNSTPEVAAELVRYTNIEKGYGVRFWSIGNEPTLFEAELKATYDTERFNREWREFALAMKAVDPTIQLVGPELHQFSGNPDANPKDSSGRDWMIEFLKANGDLVDVVTFHRYPFGDARYTATIDDLRRNAYEWDTTFSYLQGLIQEHTGRDIPVAITEINTHWSKAISGEATPDSHYNAIWWADVLGRMINNDVLMVNHWMLTSQAGQGGWGLIGRDELRPAYFTYMLYQKFGSEQVPAVSGVEHFTIYAATRADGALTIMMINLADAAQSAPLIVNGKDQSPTEAWLLAPEVYGEQVAVDSVLSDGAVSVPGHAVLLLVIP